MYSAVKATSILARLQPSLVRTHRLFASAPSFNATTTPKWTPATQFRSMSTANAEARTQHEVDTEDVADDGAGRHFSRLRFQDAPLSDATKRGMKHEFLSDVQEAVLEPGLAGEDLLVQAKTGTGKTLAFLLPAVERLAKGPPPARGKISVLVLSPTRELAIQIEDEARVLLKNHPFTVQHAIGGTSVGQERRSISGRQCDILVATPGRLMDHMENGGLRGAFSEVKSLIFDEADRLLDQGFKKELEKIVAMLPDRNVVPRQTLLFSATVSAEIKKVTSFALKTDHKFVSTLLEDEVNTHEHVEQTAIVTPMSTTWSAMLAILREDAKLHPGKSKVMVFFPTAKSTGLAGQAFRNARGLGQILEIHSRKSQGQRTRAAEDFKRAKHAVLMSSDVAARGMDFPGVTLVLQVGLPSNGEQYIHRLGRTARAGASGRGVLILSPMEAGFLRDRDVRDLGIKPHPTDLDLEAATAEVKAAMSNVSNGDKSDAYMAWLGYYKGATSRFNVSPQALVETANEFALGMMNYDGADGLPPKLSTGLALKMGLKGVRGINHFVGGNHHLEKEEAQSGGWGGFSRGGGRGGSFGGGGRSTFGAGSFGGGGRSTFGGGQRGSYAGGGGSYGRERPAYGGDSAGASYGGGRPSYGGGRSYFGEDAGGSRAPRQLYGSSEGSSYRRGGASYGGGGSRGNSEGYSGFPRRERDY